jgi:hypothetical protein
MSPPNLSVELTLLLPDIYSLPFYSLRYAPAVSPSIHFGDITNRVTTGLGAASEMVVASKAGIGDAGIAQR